MAGNAFEEEATQPLEDEQETQVLDEDRDQHYQEATQLVEEDQATQILGKHYQWTQILEAEEKHYQATQILEADGKHDEATQILEAESKHDQATQIFEADGNHGEATQILEAGGKHDQILEAEGKHDQATQILEAEGKHDQETQFLQEDQAQILPAEDYGATQLLEDATQPEIHARALFQQKGVHEENQARRPRTAASVRVNSLRKAAFAAHARLVLQIENKPDEPLEDCAKLVLKWGAKQGLKLSNFEAWEGKESSVVDDNGEAAFSAALTPTLDIQNSKSLQEMWSNNKKSNGSKAPISPKESLDHTTLGKVKKVLFAGERKEALPDVAATRHDIVINTALGDVGKGMSYLNSQDPGEESQKNALEAVDKFLYLNTTGSQSQGELVKEDATIFDMPLETTPTVQTPHLLPHLAKLQQEAATAFAWFDSQTDQDDPPGVSGKTTADEPASVPDSGESPETKPAGGRRDSIATKRVCLANHVKRKVRRASTQAAGNLLVEPGAPEDAEKTTGTATAATDPATLKTFRKRKRRSSLAKTDACPATPKADDVTPPLRKSRSGRKRVEDNFASQQISTSDTPRRCRRRPVKILFSHGLDYELLDEQKKIMKKLNIQHAKNCSDCTHFVTDKFLRTANMLEALAVGKPVVTAAWLESCRIAGCLVDERNYILQDFKKEKEFGFCMKTTFATAQNKLLFEGLTFYLTPNVKPGELRSIIEAAGGQVLKEFNSSNEDCIVVSCEEDYELCVPILDEGFKVYSSEFLMSGILGYHLDFSKNLLFSDHQPSK